MAVEIAAGTLLPRPRASFGSQTQNLALYFLSRAMDRTTHQKDDEEEYA